MKIAITGSNGFIGSKLAEYLSDKDHEIMRISRKPIREKHIHWDPETGITNLESTDSEKIDVLIHLAGVGVAEKKWDENQKQAIYSSRVQGTKTLVESLSKLENKPKLFISSSAIGYYPINKERVFTESDAPGNNFLSKVCMAWEKEALIARNHGIPIAIIRTSHVLDSSGGFLEKLLLPFKLGLGGRLGDGNQYLSWISLPDHLRAIEHIIDNNFDGTFNLSAPNPVKYREFAKALGKKLKRPTIIPTPIWPLKIIYSKEMIETVMLGSINAIPKALLETGFNFEHETIDKALHEVI